MLPKEKAKTVDYIAHFIIVSISVNEQCSISPPCYLPSATLDSTCPCLILTEHMSMI